MLSNLKLFFSGFFLLIFGAYGVFMILLVLPFSPISAQTLPRTEWQQEIERRVSTLENVNADHRLTILETIKSDEQENVLWSRISTGGMGILVAERMFRLILQKANGSSSSSNSNSLKP